MTTPASPAASAAELDEARGWLADCGLPVPTEPGSVVASVEREYGGGWHGFTRDAQLNDNEPEL